MENEVEETQDVNAQNVSSNLPVITPVDRFCRICYDLEENLITPCNCRGSLQSVHTTCLQKWLAVRDSSQCELCGFHFKVKRKLTYSLIGSFFHWLRSQESEGGELAMNVVAAFTFLTLASYGSMVLVEASNFDQTSDIWRNVSVFLIAASSSLNALCGMAAIVNIEYYMKRWYSWYRENSVVTLLL